MTRFGFLGCGAHALTFDVVIVGGGVVGLWVARHAVAAGLSVAVVDKAACGAGASGTVLGALLPHLPRAMNAKKRFQFAALAELSDLVDELEDETGVSAGYQRCGRIQPIRTPRFLESAGVFSDGAEASWRTGSRQFSVDVLDADAFGNWLAPEAAPYGVLRDTLSARIIADDYLSALKKSLVGRATIVEGVTIASVDFATRRLISPGCSLDLAGRHIVFSAGFETFGLIQSLIGLNLGHGVKGQAAVFEVASSDALPVIYDDGAYVVPQSATQCAVGSTSEDDWCDAMTTDLQDVQSIIERAQALCPPLRTGRLLKLWAGVRPRCVAKDPIVGCLDAARGLHIVTGGYKISFGIAHRLARRLVEELTGVEVLTDVPPRYTAAYHLSELQGLEGP